MSATSLLVYDLPQRSGIRNPSGRLRRLGVRVNLSCWVLPTENVPWHLLEELGRAGASWHCVPFADSGSEQVIKMAVDNLTKEVAKLAASLERSEERAAEKLNEEDARSHAAYQRRVRAALRRAERVLADSLQGAASLGIGEDALRDAVANARNTAEVIRTAAQAKAHAYAAAVERLAEGEIKAAATAAAVPEYVVADALEEQGEDASELRATFAPPAAAPIVSEDEEADEPAEEMPQPVNPWLTADSLVAV